MAVSKELIDRKVKQYKALMKDLNTLEKSLANDLIELDKQAFEGKTWGEYLLGIDETIQVNEQMRIQRLSYQIHGKYDINESVSLSVSGNIYHGDTRFRISLVYNESGKVLTEIPKKYQKHYDELIAEMQKYQVERPSDEYAKELGVGITYRL